MRSVVGRIRAYAAAVRVARAVRALPEMTPVEAFRFTQRGPWYGGDSIDADQKGEEITWLLELLRTEAPRTVLEIGTSKGGTLFLWTRVATNDALLIGVDAKRMCGHLGTRSPFALVRRSFARDQQRIELLGGVDSHDPATRDRIRALLGGRAVDFLFIDGDHRFEGVKRDFELYSPLVRSGGLIGFHDVSPATTAGTEGTARFWRELKRGADTMERVAAGVPGYGIGVYRVPAHQA